MPSEKLGEGSMSSNWENRAREGRQSWRLQMAAEVLQWGPLSIMACCFFGQRSTED